MIRRRPAVALALALASAAPVCHAAGDEAATGGERLFAFEAPHMGTLFKIKLYTDSEPTARKAATAAFNRIEALNASLSDYIPDSELNRLSALKAGEETVIGDDLHTALAAALQLARRTDGAFDPTVGHFTNLWRRSHRRGALPTREQLARVRKQSGHEKVRLESAGDPPAWTLHAGASGLNFDLGGIAKGFAADEALEAIRKFGIARAAVAAGGDIRVGDPPPGEKNWKIPLLGMDREAEVVSATVPLKNAAVSTSGDREQFVEIDGVSYSHIVDPRTGLGLTRSITATVIAPTAMQSDSHATALTVLGPERGIALVETLEGVEALVIVRDSDGEERRFESSGFGE